MRTENITNLICSGENCQTVMRTEDSTKNYQFSELPKVQSCCCPPVTFCRFPWSAPLYSVLFTWPFLSISLEIRTLYKNVVVQLFHKETFQKYFMLFISVKIR